MPPYVIFHDTTLRELAARRPSTLAELLDIPGIGERKAEVYGAAILAVLGSVNGDSPPCFKRGTVPSTPAERSEAPS